jgi:hypothetical protein
VKIFDTKRLRVRKLTPKEYGILQAFPMDRWEQVVSDSQAYKQFGNAVTTTVFTAIAEEIKKSILNAEAESEERNMEETKGFEGMNAPEEEKTDAAVEETAAVESAPCAAVEEAQAAAVEESDNVTPEKLAENIINHLFTVTILPGFVFDAAVKETADYLKENAEGLYIGNAQENKRDWAAAENAVNEMLGRYDPSGYMGKIIFPVLKPLKERLDNGERTPELFNAIVEATR